MWDHVDVWVRVGSFAGLGLMFEVILLGDDVVIEVCVADSDVADLLVFFGNLVAVIGCLVADFGID